MEAQEPTPLAATSAESWKQAAKKEQESYPLEVPSGNVALVRKVSGEEFVASGWIPNPLIQVIEDLMGIEDDEERTVEAAKKVTADRLLSMSELVDRVVVGCTIQPNVQPIPLCKKCELLYYSKVHSGEDMKSSKGKIELAAHSYKEPGRDESLLYVDEVMWDDKFAIYEFALSEANAFVRFHSEQEADVESVPNSKDVQRKAKSTAGSG